MSAPTLPQSLDRPLGVQEAYDALDAFARRAGRVPLLLLLHASVPQSFRADLLNLLKLNFVADEGSIDLTVDADVLLSPLVQPAAAGFYRLDAEVRRHALTLLDAVYRGQSERRTVQVARFLLAYADALERQAALALDAMLGEYLAIQRWVALAFIDPASAAEAFARAIDQGTSEAGAVARLRLGSVTGAISVPLAGHQGLLAYARGIDAIRSGDSATGEELLRAAAGEALVIGGVTLRPADVVIERLGGASRAREAATPSTVPDEAAQAVPSAAETPQPPIVGVPGRAPALIGREEELQRLRAMLLQVSELTASRLNAPASRSADRAPTAAVVALIAADGMGKWTLANHIVHDMRVRDHFSDGIIWLGEDGMGYPRVALKGYAELIDVPDLFDDSGNLDRNRFREVFANRTVLFVADQRSTSDIVGSLYSAGPGCVILRLIRYMPSDVQLTMELGPLHREHAKVLLRTTVRALKGQMPSNPPLEEACLDAAHGNPGLIRLVAAATTLQVNQDLLKRASANATSPADAARELVTHLWGVVLPRYRNALRSIFRGIGNQTQMSRESAPELSAPVLDELAKLGVVDVIGDMIRVPHLVEPPLWDLARSTPEDEQHGERAATQPRDLPLRVGSVGRAVRQLQKKLKELKLYSGALDGIFGAKVQSGVVLFQRSRNLPADGVVGPETRAALAPIPPVDAAPEAVHASGFEWALKNHLDGLRGRPAESTGEYREAVARLLDAAEAQTQRGDFAAALEEIQRVISLADTNGDASGRAAALSDTGNLLTRAGRFEAALQPLETALELQDKFDQRYAAGVTALRLARVYAAIGRWDRSPMFYQQARDRFERIDAYRDAALVLRELAELRAAAGNLEEGHRLAEEAVIASRHIDEPIARADALRQSAVTMARLGQLQAAERLLIETLETTASDWFRVYEQQGAACRSMILAELGGVRVAAGNITAALDAYKEAWTIALEFPEQPPFLEVADRYAQVLLVAGRRADAKAVLVEAMNPAVTGEMPLSMAQRFQDLDRTPDTDAARRALEQAIGQWYQLRRTNPPTA